MIQAEEIELFKQLIHENRYDFCKLVYIIFPFGEKGHPLEHMAPYDWQMQEWAKISKHLSDPRTRHEAYRLIISSGNGAAKTSFGAMTFFMLMYTQRVRARITANTQPQMTSIVWPEYDVWFRHARYSEYFFEKLGQSIKARDQELGETWRLDAVTWNEATPASISGLHNKGGAIVYIFEEAAGIPSIIWKYASGAMTDTDTIKIWMAFANSDDPESQFEQNMVSPFWNSRRIDTREMPHVDPKQIAIWLAECNGNEDHDDFRVRVRGLPRKTAKDSIINQELVAAAIKRAETFDTATLSSLPVIIMCDPAWTGGDETVIWYRQGPYARLLDRYKLDKSLGQDHMFTYLKLVRWESELRADAVFIDQGEGTAIKTLANNAGKMWELVNFASSPNDVPEAKDSQYGNMRAQMYYECNKWLQEGAVIDAREPEWLDDIQKQLCWTKGTRHKITGKKMAEPKADIVARVGRSPDISDGLVLGFSRVVPEKLSDNLSYNAGEIQKIGGSPFMMPEYDPYHDEDYSDLYN